MEDAFNDRIDTFVGFVLIHHDTVLLQLRDQKDGIYYPGYWSIPGGRVKRGETPQIAAQRELKEETGYLSTRATPFFMDVEKDGLGTLARRYFVLSIYDQQQPISCYEGQEMRFRNATDLFNENIIPGHIEIIERAMKIAYPTFPVN